MENEPQPPRLSDREQKILRIRTQLEHVAQFEHVAAGKTRWLEELATERRRLEAELEKLEQGQEKPE